MSPDTLEQRIREALIDDAAEEYQPLHRSVPVSTLAYINHIAPDIARALEAGFGAGEVEGLFKRWFIDAFIAALSEGK